MAYYTHYKKTCIQCGQEFQANRGDAKFCSANCRKASSRRKENIDRVWGKTSDNVRWLARQVEEHPDLTPHIREILFEISGATYRAVKRIDESVTPASVTAKDGDAQ